MEPRSFGSAGPPGQFVRFEAEAPSFPISRPRNHSTQSAVHSRDQQPPSDTSKLTERKAELSNYNHYGYARQTMRQIGMTHSMNGRDEAGDREFDSRDDPPDSPLNEKPRAETQMAEDPGGTTRREVVPRAPGKNRSPLLLEETNGETFLLPNASF